MVLILSMYRTDRVKLLDYSRVNTFTEEMVSRGVNV